MKNKLTIATFTIASSFSLSSQQKPNIIFVLADDLGWTDLKCTGSDFYETPNIDKLRENGILFTQAYSNAPNSAPSRASLMTGLYTPRHGIYTVNPPDRGKAENRKLIAKNNKDILDTSIITFPEILKDNGYQTIHIGKWHLGDDSTDTGPLANGFDINIAGSKIGSPYSYYYPFYTNESKKLQNLSLEDKSTHYLTDRLTKEAIEQIKNNKDKPFFIYLSHYAVHTPLQAINEIKEKYDNKKSGKYHNNSTYAAMIESLDNSVGAIVKTLEEIDEIDNTIIVFFSDNGGVLNGITDNSPLRGEKGTPYEGGNRVPLIICYPNNINKNITSDIPIMGIDIFPTILDIANIKHSHATDGKSFKIVLTEDEAKHLKDRNLFFYFPAYLESYGSKNKFRATPYASIISDEWKLIYFFENNKVELYNLKNDIGENNNRANTDADRATHMTNILFNWMQKIGASYEFIPNPHFKTTNKNITQQ